MNNQFSYLQAAALAVLTISNVHLASAQSSGNIPERVIHYADTIVINGNIVTMDNTEIMSADPGSIVQAMAIRDGTILDLGSDAYIKSLAGPSTRIMDVKGKTVIPGLIETHVHPETTLNETPSVQVIRDSYQLAPGLHMTVTLEVGEDPSTVLDKLTQKLQTYPPESGEWVHINLITLEEHEVYPDQSAMTDGIYKVDAITLEDLTRVVPNNPAVMQNGRGTSAVRQRGLVIRIRVGSDGKSIVEPLSVPETAAPSSSDDHNINPFLTLFSKNIARDREEDLHVHLEQGCAWSEKYPHHGQHCSHNVAVMNRLALEKTVDVWPGFIAAANAMTSLTENGGDRGLIGGVLNDSGAWVTTLFPPRVPRDMYRGWLKKVMEHYAEAGLTMISSSIENGRTLTAFYEILREDKRLPVRFGYGYEMLRTPLLYPNHPQLPVQLGSHWGPPEANPWFWPMGITDGGSGDSRRVACFGEDLPGTPELKDREQCMDIENYRIKQVLIPAIKAGWRIFSMHSFGSEQFRLHAAWIDRARREARMSMDDIRKLRLSFAHGGAVGKVPDVMETMIDYNFYVPIRPSDVAESLVQVKRYGPEGLEFLAPTKTLLEAGVKVVGEGGHELDPSIYFRDISMFITRKIKDPSDEHAEGEIVMPEEAVNRTTALRLYTSRASEWLFAEDMTGTLERGKLADFVVIDRDFFSVPVAEIEDNKILMTVVGDEVIYKDPEWEPGR
ncbi:MAG: amidohydrolase family protein [Gammaproteobacteria bacterium]